MNAKQGPAHVVVDGSNLATEGRSMPSLAQLSDAVMSFMEENPDTEITVVVDATFGHRIDKKETKEFEEGISNNELVAPPAGAVGRGDAFVLGIADKAGSTVLSNDSFQEFHGEYEWLFDEGRLVGGKPVPHVGWVWVARTPVRGPVSRKATRGSASSASTSGRGRSRGGRGRSRQDEGAARVGSAEASGPMPVPKSPPPAAKKAAAKQAVAQESSESSGRGRDRQNGRQSETRAPRGGDPVNELLPFLEFVEHHPVGTDVTGTVDSYSSHGAYITMGEETRGYIPLRMMAEPTPRSAKSIMKVGESVEVVVVSFNGARRSIDCALPDMADAAIAEAEAEAEQDVDAIIEEGTEMVDDQQTKQAPAKKGAAKKATAKKSAAKQAPAKKGAAKKATATKATEKKSAAVRPSGGTVDRIPAKKTPVKQAAPKQAAPAKTATKTATKTAVAAKKPVAKTAVVKKTATKKPAVKKPAVKKPAAKKPAAKKPAVKKPAPKKPAAKKPAAKKTIAKKTPVKKIAAKKTAVKKMAAKKTATKKTAAAKRS
jgi:predicted RNA-binding protein with RPS1 domain